MGFLDKLLGRGKKTAGGMTGDSGQIGLKDVDLQAQLLIAGAHELLHLPFVADHAGDTDTGRDVLDKRRTIRLYLREHPPH